MDLNVRRLKVAINLKKFNNAVVVIPEQERIDASNAPQFKSELVDLIFEGYTNIALDFNYVDFMDSSGLSALLSCVKTLGGKGKFVLFSMNDKVRNLFRITKLDQRVFHIFDSQEQALKE